MRSRLIGLPITKDLCLRQVKRVLFTARKRRKNPLIHRATQNENVAIGDTNNVVIMLIIIRVKTINVLDCDQSNYYSRILFSNSNSPILVQSCSFVSCVFIP